MPTLHILPDDITIDLRPGTPLLDGLGFAEKDVHAPCGGSGTCGKCTVRVISGSLRHRRFGSLAQAGDDILACCTEIGDDHCCVLVPDTENLAAHRQRAEDDSQLVDRDLLPNGAPSPVCSWRSIQVDAPQLEDGLGDYERLQRALGENITVPLPVLRQLAEQLRKNNGQISCAIDEQRLLACNAEEKPALACAIDIGTTTVIVEIIDCHSGLVLATRSGYNQQISRGLDVISRINYCRRPSGLKELRRLVLRSINTLLREACQAIDENPKNILSAFLAGNTTMVHLLLGLEPEAIRIDPFTPTMLAPPVFTAQDLGLAIADSATARCAPAVGSYVGGDILAGLLCSPLARNEDSITCFLDIGTNGELVIGNADFLVGCACSAGPAFEGGGIDCGMRAAPGAIASVRIDPSSGLPTCQTIDDEAACGICGSGMITLLAELLRSGWIDAAGRLDRNRPCPAIRQEGRRASYFLTKDIAISEHDIANIIRAKAAIFSAIQLLLAQLELGLDQVERFCIAGGFGRYLDLEAAISIGLLPDIPRQRYQVIGNSALTGARSALLSATHRQKLTELAQRLTYLDLCSDAAYMDAYTAAQFLPHTDSALFPSLMA